MVRTKKNSKKWVQIVSQPLELTDQETVSKKISFGIVGTERQLLQRIHF